MLFTDRRCQIGINVIKFKMHRLPTRTYTQVNYRDYHKKDSDIKILNKFRKRIKKW